MEQFRQIIKELNTKIDECDKMIIVSEKSYKYYSEKTEDKVYALKLNEFIDKQKKLLHLYRECNRLETDIF